jgi:hypothetical protein
LLLFARKKLRVKLAIKTNSQQQKCVVHFLYSSLEASNMMGLAQATAWTHQQYA